MSDTATQSHPQFSSGITGMALAWEASAYALDAMERWILFLDVLRERSQRYAEHTAKPVPHVLKFDYELVKDGRELARPVNYALVSVKPPPGAEVDKTKRPFVVVDPRAGHGPGIGGFKASSEVGAAFQAGHPCYFIGFSPKPVPGQTMADVVDAQADFIEIVAALHDDADGRPAVVGNCQAGWAVMMAAARRPWLFGPLIIAGSPLSYWGGEPGQNPMRYTGGMVGGSWMTALMSDLGGGMFDGAWLVSNFEKLNPANTLWTKHHDLYVNIDKGTSRYLEFEQWWGTHTLLNAQEIQFIVDELFISNKLASAEVTFPDGVPVDLRAIRSPIVVFCSKADNITPPGQALGWIRELYASVDDIRAHGQTIVYAAHETAGHLGIFVSGAVAKKEHREFASNIDLIDVLPPGLYEAVMTPRQAGHGRPDLVGGDHLVRFEARTMEDLDKLGCNSDEDDRRFATVERMSEINLNAYRTFAQPWVRFWIDQNAADIGRRLHPLRLQHELISSTIPTLADASTAVERIRQSRHSVPPENALWQAQEHASRNVEAALDGVRIVRDWWIETLFNGVYGAPLLQAALGIAGHDGKSRRRRPGRDPMHDRFIAARQEQLRRNIAEGGPRDATIRALLYIRLPDGIADERAFRLIQHIHEEAGAGMDLPAFKRMVRDQYFTLLIDERAAVEAIPQMLSADPDLASLMAAALRRVIDVTGIPSEDGKARADVIKRMFEAAVPPRPARQVAAIAGARHGGHETSPPYMGASSGKSHP